MRLLVILFSISLFANEISIIHKPTSKIQIKTTNELFTLKVIDKKKYYETTIKEKNSQIIQKFNAPIKIFIQQNCKDFDKTFKYFDLNMTKKRDYYILNSPKEQNILKSLLLFYMSDCIKDIRGKEYKKPKKIQKTKQGANNEKNTTRS